MLIRDAAYQAMPKEQRAELHELFARWLTRTVGDRLAEYQEILGYHLEQAYRFRTELGPVDEPTRELGREAGRALRASSERAQARGDFVGTSRLLERSIALLDGFERAGAIVELGEHLVWVDQNLQALEVLREFLSSTDAGEWPTLRIRAEVYRIFAESGVDPSRLQEESQHAVRALLAEAEALGDDEAMTTCLLGMGQWAFWLGRSHEQHEISKRLLPRIDDLRFIHRDWVAAGFRTDAVLGIDPHRGGTPGRRNGAAAGRRQLAWRFRL